MRVGRIHAKIRKIEEDHEDEEMENGEARGVTYYKCDVKDKARVGQVAAEIERDVSWPTHRSTVRRDASPED